MMAKKDFTGAVQRVHDGIAEAIGEAIGAETPDAEDAQEVNDEQQTQPEPQTRKARREYTEEEAAEYMASGQTAGRKGCKMARVNMAFRPDVFDYLKIMARVRGQSMTDFVNDVLQASMKANAEVYEQAKAFRTALLEDKTGGQVNGQSARQQPAAE